MNTSTNRFLTALQLLFKVRPGEGVRVLMMFGYSVVAIGGALIIGRSASRILFLSQLPQHLTPYKFILPPLFVVLAMLCYTRLTARFRLSHLIIGLSLLMMVGVLLFRYLLETAAAGSFALLATLYMYTEMVAALVSVKFWTYATDIFDARQAKRLFGLIAAGGVMSNVLAGVGLQAAAAVVAPKDLLFVVAASLLGCAWLVFVLERGREKEETAVPAPPPAGKQPAGNLRQDLQAVWRTPLLVSLGGIIIIMSLVTNIADYQLDLSLQRFFYADGSRMLSFLGMFQIVTGILAVTMQLLATNRLMERFGLVTSLLILPVSISLGAGLTLVTGGMLVAAAWPRGSDVVFRYTVNDAAMNTFFLPIQPALRRRAKAILDGIVKPLAMGVAGLLFLLFQVDSARVEAGTIMAWSVPTLLLTAVWLLLVQRVRSQYRGALADSLRRRRLELGSREIELSDETAVQVLAQSLEDPDPLQVIHGLNLMRQAPKIDWLPFIAPQVNHPSLEVRLLVLGQLGEARRAEFGDLVATQFTAAEPRARAAAIEAYCAIYEEAAIERVAGFLEDEDAHIRNAAIVGLVRYGGLDGVLQSAHYLKRMLASESIELRRLGAQVLGQLGAANFYRSLQPLLADPVQQVQIAAIRAAGELRHPALLPQLIAALGREGTAAAATDALVAYGADVVPALAAAWQDDGSAAVSLQIPRVLQRLPTEAAAALLLGHLEDGHEHLRGRVLRALTRLQSCGVPIKVAAATLQQQLQREARRYYEWLVIEDDLGEQGRGVLLGEGIQAFKGYTMDRLFYLFALLYPEQNIRQLQQGLTQGDRRLRANAIELLDTIVSREIKELVLPLLEMEPKMLLALARTRLGIPSRLPAARLAELMEYPSSWLQACVLFQIGSMRLQELEHLVKAGLAAEDMTVREAALYAGKQLMPATEFREVLLWEKAAAPEPAAGYAGKLLADMDSQRHGALLPGWV